MLIEDKMKELNINEKAIVNSWRELIEIESYTFDKMSVSKVCQYVKKKLEDLQLETKVYTFENAGPLLIAEIGEGADADGIILSGHMDTVFKIGTLNERPFSIDDNKVFGPGVLDMKGGLNLIFYIIPLLHSLGFNNKIKVIIAGDEEHGHQNSNCADIMKREAQGYKCAFNLETGLIDNKITIARKGRVSFDITAHGKSAHSGADLNNGINAIYDLVNILQKINHLSKSFSNVSVSPNLIQGGEMINSVPEFAKVQFDIRYYDESEKDKLLSQIIETCNAPTIEGSKIAYTIDDSFPAFTDHLNHPLFNLVKSTGVELGLEKIAPAKLGGSSDAAFLSKAGVPCICSIGVKGEHNHTDREYALLSSAMERIILITETIMKLSTTYFNEPGPNKIELLDQHIV